MTDRYDLDEDEREEALQMAKEFLRLLSESIPEDYEPPEPFGPEEGIYRRAELHTPDGGVFIVGRVRVWGGRLNNRKQNVDVPIERVPEHLHDSGLGECELVIFGDGGETLLRGPLRDDGNRQDAFGHICVAVENPEVA